MKVRKKLSTAIVEAAKPATRPVVVWDEVVRELFLRVAPSGIKSFSVMWDRCHAKTIGRHPGLTVEAARTRARAALIETTQSGAPVAVRTSRQRRRGELPADQEISLANFVERHYAPWVKGHHKNGAATVAGLEATWADLLERQLQKISAFDIERIKVARQKAGKKPATVNRDLDRIRSCLTRATDWGFLSANPMKTVRKLKGVDNGRVRFLTADEEDRLREALGNREAEHRAERTRFNAHRKARKRKPLPMWGPKEFTDHLKPMALLALNTGMRRGEIFGLTWDLVDLPRALVTIAAGVAKSRRSRHIDLNAEAVDVLTRWKQAAGGDRAKGLVFPSVEGSRFNNIAKSWDGVVTEAKLVDFNFHDLRHTFASKLVSAGVDLNTVRELLGHSDLAMTLRYSHLAPAKKAAAVARLAGVKL